MGIFQSKPTVETGPSIDNQNPLPVFHGNPSLVFYNARNQKIPIMFIYSFIGSGYHGLQLDRHYRTIETDLFTALMDSYLIPPDSYNKLSTIGWRQSSRTDKGVHAAAALCSFFYLLRNEINYQIIPQLINDHLPKDSTIHVSKFDFM